MTAPWVNGVHQDYTAFTMEVHVRRNKDGGVTSHSNPQSEEDLRTSHTMEGSHGMVEGSWALLAEAAKAEALIQLLVRLSNDVEFKKNLASGSGIEESLLKKLSEDTFEQMRKSLEELLPNLIHSTVKKVQDGLRDQIE